MEKWYRETVQLCVEMNSGEQRGHFLYLTDVIWIKKSKSAIFYKLCSESESQVNYFEYFYKIAQTSHTTKIDYCGVILTEVSFPTAVAFTLPRLVCNSFATPFWLHGIRDCNLNSQYLVMGKEEELWGHKIKGEWEINKEKCESTVKKQKENKKLF